MSFAPEEKSYDSVMAAAKLLGESMLNGSADAEFNLPKGTILRTFELFANRRMSLPVDLLAAAALKDIAEYKKSANDRRSPNMPAIGYKNEVRAFENLTKGMSEACMVYIKGGSREHVVRAISAMMPELGENQKRFESLFIPNIHY